MAILFVMTSIVILSLLLFDFSFEVQMNKLRTLNSQDQLQARLNAEAGLNLALLRLKLYQEGRNLLEKNKSIASSIRVTDLNKIWNVPFIYPIPLMPKTKLEIKQTVEKFMKDSLLVGGISTEIQNVSHLINLNLLRMAKPKIKKNDPNKKEQNNEDQDQTELNSTQIILNLEKRLVELFRQKFDKRLEDDEEFERKYSNVEPELLIKEIKYYINDAHREFGPEVNEIRSDYMSEGIQAKHAPFESLSELYMLKNWDDELVDMIKNEVTVHGVIAIDLNQITDQGLKLLIPEINDEQIKDFFEYRDDPIYPNPFNSLEDFKVYIVNTAQVLTSFEMKERIEKFF